ncbi:receptor-like protein EIX2 [Ziziphus jujuba]|uniref:Receptor-like protein EIX2 n=1 Tax=Ziziphus jujuba TaxID=326968 RepID=A0ABM4A2D4_ZIZJJ|nr:receptor-like protein EIX2 [Ziziphus jujuba]
MEAITWLPLMFLILCSVRGELLPNIGAHLMNCMESDREALIDFKNGLHDPANRLSSWKGSNCCHWRGISCENTTGAVIAVDLRNPHPTYNYNDESLDSGAIPLNLANLSSLQYLDVSCDDIWEESSLFVDNLKCSSGSIPPPTFLNLISLVVLDLSDNQFLPKVLDFLVNVSSLVTLDMSNNWLDGRIPLDFSELPNLQFLYLGASGLSESCHQMLGGRWEKIQDLDFGRNDLHRKLPSSIGNLTFLSHLDLSGNSVDGGIPSSIGKLCNLILLDVSDNYINETLPKFLEGIEICLSRKPFPILQSFDLSYNYLVGNLPEWLGHIENLVELDLSLNYLNGQIPAFFGSLQNLSRGPLPSLQYLDLSDDYLVGNLPEWLCQLENLVNLNLWCNSLNGSIAASFGSLQNLSRRPLPNLQSLDLSDNHLVGKLPKWLAQLENLIELDLSNNSLYGPIPTSFGILQQNLTILLLGGNELNGTLLESLGQLSGLRKFNVSSNQLTGLFSCNEFLPFGSFISDLAQVTKAGNIVPGLEVFDLSNNNLRGSIPSSIGNCSDLSALDISNNHLSGTIRTFLGQLRGLKTLHLNDNRLYGQLPSSFQNLSSLATLNLGNNRLNGRIPPWIGKVFESLRILGLRPNSFSRELPVCYQI